MRQWETFQRLNHLKRWEASILNQDDEATWLSLRLQIEASIFHQPLYSDPDRRRCLRVPCSLGMRYDASGQVDARTLTNLGEGGCLVMTQRPLSPGEPLVLEIFAPEFACRGITARVAWIETDEQAPNRGMGLAFLGPTPEQRSALEALIDKLVRIRMGFMAPFFNCRSR